MDLRKIRIENELESLLELQDTSKLKKSVIAVFMDFLKNNKSDLPSNFEDIIDDFHYLINFLEQIDKNNYMKKSVKF